MYRFLVSLCVVITATNSFADTEFEGNVPLDLVKALLGSSPYGDPDLFSDLSSSFPEIEIPAGFEVLGSLNRSYGITAVFTTALAEEEAEQRLIDAYVGAAYQEFLLVRPEIDQGGFVAANFEAPKIGTRYCHDANGFLSHGYREVAAGRIVTITGTPANGNGSCAKQLAEQEQHFSRMGLRSNGLRTHMPTLVLPEVETQLLTPFLSSGYSGSNNGIETSSRLNIDWDIEEVFRHFAEQMDDQGWSADSENIGSASGTGIWTLNPEPDSNLIGTLSVYKTGDESFELKFQLTSTSSSTSNVFFN